MVFGAVVVEIGNKIRDFKEFSGKHPRSYLSEIDSFLFE